MSNTRMSLAAGKAQTGARKRRTPKVPPADERLRRSEDTLRLLMSLYDATRALPGPADLATAKTARIGEHFGAQRCIYAQVDAQQRYATVQGAYANGVIALLDERHALDNYGAACADALRAGRSVVIADVRSDPRTAATEVLAHYRAMQTQALMLVPLRRDTELRAVLGLHYTKPQEWVADDTALLETVAQRTGFLIDSARAQGALRQSRDVLALAMRAGRMGAWSRDLRTDAVWWSPELEALLGLPTGSFAGHRDHYLALVDPEHRPALRTAVDHAIATGTDYTVEFRIRHADGSWRWMEGRGRATQDAAGQPVMLYGLGIDVTERKHTDEQLRRLNEELSRADRRKDEFLATLAHELRNPLAPMRNAVALLRRQGGDSGPLQQTCDIIDRQVQQMTRLVDDLLDLGRIARGKIDVRPAPLDLADAVRAAVESARPMIDAARHRLAVKLPREPLPLNADLTRLAQALANLLNNAATYTPHGGSIELSAEHSGSDALLTIRDSGIGIAPENLERIFGMFEQVTPALERRSGGLGIGLALVRGLIELHGGRVEARSAGLGHGAEFIVRLPLRPVNAAAAPQPQPQRAEPLRTPPRRVLVADDNRDAAQSLGWLLQLAGHDVRIADNGEEACRVAETFRPDVALLDIGMPQLNGYEAAAHLRAQPWADAVTLIALTGWGTDGDKQRSSAAGFDAHLTKPVDPALLDTYLLGARATRAAGPQ